MSRHAILCITFGFLAGVLARSFFDLGAAAVWFGLVLAAGAVWQARLAPPAGRARWLAAALFFLFAALGVGRFEVKDRSEFASAFDLGTARPSALSGLIVAEPDLRDQRAQLVFRPDDWPVKVLLSAPLYPAFTYGARLAVTGRLERLGNFTARDTGQLVPYADYLAVSEIYFQMFEPEITLLASGQGNPIKAGLLKFKQRLLTRLTRAVPEPEASLVAGLTLGARQSLGEAWTERLRRVGLIHIVVLSGYNLSIVAAAITAALSFLRRRYRLLLAALAIGLFTLMVGAGPATVRAAIMALIALLAQATGRRYAAGRALGAAAVLMVAVNPKVLVFDSGFQLSFLATAGLIWLAPKIAARLQFIKWPAWRELVAVTVAAQLAVLPWFVWKSVAVPALALPANLLVLPVVPYAMFFGFLAMLAPALAGLTWPIAAAAWLLARYILAVAGALALLF